MKIKNFVFNAFRENTYVVSDSSGECIFVDAGCHTPHEEERLAEYVQSQNLTPVGVYSTHGHIDHILGNSFVCQKYNIQHYLHPLDFFFVENALQISTDYGFRLEQPLPTPLPLGAQVKFGNTVLQVLHVPGHSQGGVAFYSAEHKVVFSGDTLFADCIGRTDLYGGDYDQIMHSLRTQLMTLPDETEVLPGHGAATQIDTERLQNPFLQPITFEQQ